MALTAEEVLALSKKYTDNSIAGGGAIKGKNCIVSDISPITGGNRVTFQWTLDNGTVQTGTMDVMNGEQGEQGETGETGRGIAHASVDAETEHLIITYDDGTIEDAGKITVSGGSGELQDDLTTSVTVGGITSGTTYEEGTSLETIFREMLNPVEYPTLTNPSATLSATGAKLLETGATLDTTMTLTLNRGSISPAYGTSGYRSGVATSYTLEGATQTESNTFSITVTSEKTSYQGSIAYGAGEQPKDSVGNDYSTPLAAGSVNSNTLKYEFVDALWANVSNIATIAKQALVSKSTKQKIFNFPSATVANPEVFDVPASWTLTALEVLNTLNNQWENCSSEFSTSNVTHEDASGTEVNYVRYTCNLGYAMGARQIRIKWL